MRLLSRRLTARDQERGQHEQHDQPDLERKGPLPQGAAGGIRDGRALLQFLSFALRNLADERPDLIHGLLAFAVRDQVDRLAASSRLHQFYGLCGEAPLLRRGLPQLVDEPRLLATSRQKLERIDIPVDTRFRVPIGFEKRRIARDHIAALPEFEILMSRQNRL
ncbi:MAG: hypothetical protein WA940_20305 [Sphingopyxis sp.]